MARRRTRRKMPLREDFMLKEQKKIEEGVFDIPTMLKLRRLFSHNIIASLGFIIAEGKESDVYVAEAGSAISPSSAFVAVKIFRIETTGFVRRKEYLAGDPRFGKVRGNGYEMVATWCKKEYGNLKIAANAGIHAPLPYFFSGNILAMELITDSDRPSRSMKLARLQRPEETFKTIISDTKRLYEHGLVHADLSEYNILIRNETPYMIDFGQAVVVDHPKSGEYLERDIKNISAYFRKTYGIASDPKSIIDTITG